MTGKSLTNNWLFSRRFLSANVERYGNSTTTIEKDEAEAEVREWYQNRRGRSMVTEWSDLADPLELAAIHDWDVRSVGGAEPS